MAQNGQGNPTEQAPQDYYYEVDFPEAGGKLIFATIHTGNMKDVDIVGVYFQQYQQPGEKQRDRVQLGISNLPVRASATIDPFAESSARLSEEMAHITTTEERDALTVLRERYQRLKDLSDRLPDALTHMPFPQLLSSREEGASITMYVEGIAGSSFDAFIQELRTIRASEIAEALADNGAGTNPEAIRPILALAALRAMIGAHAGMNLLNAVVRDNPGRNTQINRTATGMHGVVFDLGGTTLSPTLADRALLLQNLEATLVSDHFTRLVPDFGPDGLRRDGYIEELLAAYAFKFFEPAIGQFPRPQPGESLYNHTITAAVADLIRAYEIARIRHIVDYDGSEDALRGSMTTQQAFALLQRLEGPFPDAPTFIMH